MASVGLIGYGGIARDVVAALRELDPQMAITDQREIVAND